MEGGGLTAKLGSLLHQTTKKLGEVVSLEYGKPLKKEDRKEGDYPVFGSNGIVGFHDEFIVQGPCIIVGRKGSAGEVTFTEKSAFPIDTAFFVSLRDENTNLKYIYYILQKLPLKTLNIQAAVPGLNRNDAYDLEIPLPPLPEQKRIVAILDEAFEGIDKVVANTKKNLANARELFDSYLNNIYRKHPRDVVMWKTVKLGDVCEILDRHRKPITKKDRVEGEYPYYGATGIVDWVDDYIFDEELVLIGEDGAKWEAGEKTAFIAKGKYWVNNHAHVVKPHADKLLSKWITYYLCGIDLKPWVTGLTVPKLNQAQLNSIPVPFLPLPEQKRIVAKLDVLRVETQRLEAIYQQKLTALTELKQSFLQRAFTGELTAEDKTIKIEAVA